MPRTVLVVEDDADFRESVSSVLREQGYEVVEACDGLDALDVLETTRPGLILLDLMMPRFDGYGFRELQQGDPAISNIPVVAITAHRDGIDALEPMEVLLKPIALAPLLEAVLRYF